MSEVAVRDVPVPAVYADDPTGGRLVAWAQAASAAHQLAKALTTTAFCPQHFKGNDGDATAAIIAGDEVGMPPLAALRSIYVVHGTPAMYARTMRALALSHGHEMWTEKSTDSEVVVCGRRRGSEHIERAVWTMARATKAGYTSNKKYGSNPQEMLQAKADAEIARKIAADVLAGIPFSVEDLELEPGSVTVSREAPAKPRQVSRKKPAVEPPVQAEPAFDDEPVAEPEDEPVKAEEMISDPQMKALHASFNDAGITERAERLDFCMGVVGRDIDSSKDLTRSEASSVLDRLKSDGDN